MSLTIENENSLRRAVATGCNLFLGAGFSLLAKGDDDDFLPTGDKLADELSEAFECPRLSLPEMATIIQSKNLDGFNSFIKHRFTVKDYDPVYKKIANVRIKNIFTTNVDDLVQRVIHDSSKRYLNDMKVNGPSPEDTAINYLALHGCVSEAEQRFVFSSIEIATIFSNERRIWGFLSSSTETYPTLFLGYGMNDTGTLNALFSRATFNNAQKEKWILVHDSSESLIPYYQALGFSIIRGDIKSFLDWIPEIEREVQINNQPPLQEYFGYCMVSKGMSKDEVVRPIDVFFRGAAPIWHDIKSGFIYKTSFYNKIQDNVLSGKKHTIIIGAPATGKTTLAMQVAYGVNYPGQILFFDSLTDTRTEFLIKIIGKSRVLIFLDNFSDYLDSFIRLSDAGSNINVVGVDRSHYFNIVSHKLPMEKYNVINVSDPTENDLQGIFNTLPVTIRNGEIKRGGQRQYSPDTIFEFVLRNISKSNIAERYDEVLKTLIEDDQLLAEFLVLCTYVHASRIPLSSEMAIAYFSEDCSYNDVFEMRAELNDLIKDFDVSFTDLDSNMDYYYPKSYYIAECVLKKCPSWLLRVVLNKFINNLTPVVICNYSSFKKHGFDKTIISKAFERTSEGQDFYERAFLFDYQNPFVLQQGALFLSSRRRYTDAFNWIDRAINMTGNRYFSIRNSHAVILFDANIGNNDVSARVILDQSMSILEKCINDDKRVIFHALTYASQAIEYAKRYNDSVAFGYIDKAIDWLRNEIELNDWNVEVKLSLQKLRNYRDNVVQSN
jgi:tetratricopeptide (TPR) repeat protein